MQDHPEESTNNFGETEKPNENEILMEDTEELKKGHRRSKNDTEGRTYKCKLCGKSYLSYPALYTHSKQKHNTCNTSGRGRGRPKKETNEVSFSNYLKLIKINF